MLFIQLTLKRYIILCIVELYINVLYQLQSFQQQAGQLWATEGDWTLVQSGKNKSDNLIFCVSCGTKFSQDLIFPIFCSSFCDLPKTKLPPKLNPLAKLCTRKSHVKSRLRCMFLKGLFLSEIKRMKLETKLQENKR